MNLDEVCIAILRLLLALRKKDPARGGATEKMLMDSMGADVMNQLGTALSYLREQAYIETEDQTATITAKGLNYLIEVSECQIPDLASAILQALEAEQSKHSDAGSGEVHGLSGRGIMDCLQTDEISEFQFALFYLQDMGYIQTGNRTFEITARGLAFLTQHQSNNNNKQGPLDLSDHDDSAKNSFDFTPD